MQTKMKFMGKNYIHSSLKNNSNLVVIVLILLFYSERFYAQCSGTNTDGDGYANLCDADDDNDGILDINELCAAIPGAASPDTTNQVYWSLNGFDVYTIGGNTNGLGYQESGFQEGAYNQGKSLTVLDGSNDYSASHSGDGTAILSTVTFANGTMRYVSNHPVNGRAEFRDTTAGGFISGNSGDGVYVEPELGLGVGDYYSIEIDFTTPVTAFSLDIIDAFDTFTTNNPELSYQVYADGKLIAYLKGNAVGDDSSGTVNIYDGDDNLKGTHTVGQNIESAIGFVTLESVSQVVIRHDVTSGSIRSGSFDPHGFDSLAYSTDFCDTDGDGIANHLDKDSDNDGCYDALEASGNYNYTQLTNGAFTGVDSNGVPSTVGSTGQTNNSAVTDASDSSACCDVSVSGFTDSDSDNVVDSCDLDDDNDGILDVNEGFCNGLKFTFDSDNEGWVEDNRNNGTLGSALAHSSSGTTQAPDNCTISSGLLASALNGGFVTMTDNASFDMYFESPTFSAIDLSNQLNTGQLSFYWANGVYGGTAPTQSSTTLDVVLNGGGISVSATVDVTGEHDGAWRQKTLNLDDATWSGTLADLTTVLSTLTKIEIEVESIFSRNIGASSATCADAEWFALDEVIICSNQDTDEDGIPDYLDTDSDNDGCSDAIEGDGNIVDTSLLVDFPGGSVGGSIQNLGTTVNVNGIPTVITGGTTSGTETTGQGNTTAVIDDSDNTACTVDLNLTKTVSNALPKVGDVIVYRLTIENKGLLNATGVNVTDVLPGGLNYDGTYTASQGTYDEGTDLWTIGTVNIGEIKTLDITVTVDNSGTIINTTEITQSNQTDIDSLPNNGN